MIEIDGRLGEGGGQVLRTALALCAVTKTPLRIESIRGKRPRPGLLRQHLTAVRAMAEVCSARVQGAELGSTALTFSPDETKHGSYDFQVGTAGSATLVLQTVLPALLVVPGESSLSFEGGTHNAWAPSFDFIEHTFLSVLGSMGAHVELHLERHGFYPAGGGRFLARITGGAPLKALSLTERGALDSVRIRALVSGIPERIAEREVKTLAKALTDLPITVETETVESPGPGNVVEARVQSTEIVETLTAFGERGKKAASVARQLAREVRKYLLSEAPVGEHLAYQLLLPLALSGKGEFVAGEPSPHTTTNLEVIGLFLPGRVVMRRQASGVRFVATG